MPGRDDSSQANERRIRQRRFWTTKYAEDAAFFGARESDFARWCVRYLRKEAHARDLVELGCGYGRDVRYLSGLGFRVRGVELARIPPSVPTSRSSKEAVPEIIEGDALEFLQNQGAQSLDAVYSNMFLNMDFTEGEHRELLRAVHRVLRPGGLHLYSARSTSDPWYGRGNQVGPDTFDPVPHGVTMHYFSREYADRLADGLFTVVARQEAAEGGEEFPIRLLYAVDRRL